jgi:hypothetical protein
MGVGHDYQFEESHCGSGGHRRCYPRDELGNEVGGSAVPHDGRNRSARASASCLFSTDLRLVPPSFTPRFLAARRGACARRYDPPLALGATLRIAEGHAVAYHGRGPRREIGETIDPSLVD